MSVDHLGAKIASLYELQSAWMEPRLSKAGIRWTTFQLLATIASAGSEASQAEVARRLGVAPATLSESVQKHVQDGYVQQSPSPHDRRLKILQLTPEGQRLVGKIRNLALECDRVLVQALKEKEAKTCAKVLDQMIDSLERALESSHFVD